MGQRLPTLCARDEAPFQLWADLGCPGLYEFHPIALAAYEARYRADQKRQGILRLDECHLEAPRG
jgi:hypothetical protein